MLSDDIFHIFLNLSVTVFVYHHLFVKSSYVFTHVKVYIFNVFLLIHFTYPSHNHTHMHVLMLSLFLACSIFSLKTKIDEKRSCPIIFPSVTATDDGTGISFP